MRAADLDDGRESRALLIQGLSKPVGCSEKVLQRQHGGDVHRGGKHVIRRLAEVDVVIGMDQPLRATLAAEQLRGPVGEHVVAVQLALLAGPGLPTESGNSASWLPASTSSASRWMASAFVV